MNNQEKLLVLTAHILDLQVKVRPSHGPAFDIHADKTASATTRA
jgi:hypothetical protein